MTSANSPSETLVARLGKLESGQVSDVLDEAGLPDQVLASSLFALASGLRFAGRAACARGASSVSARHGAPILPPDALERTIGPDSVLVIAAGGFVTGACIGGFIAYSLQREGCRGLITDGAVRDVEEIKQLGFPVFCAAVTPINGARRWRLTETGTAVTLPGQTGVPVTIHPGDFILADGDGVIVVPAAVAEQVIADSEQLSEIEGRINDKLRAGGHRADVFKANPRFDHIRRY